MPYTKELGQQQMPRYKCHKIVWALKIARIEQRGDGWVEIYPADEGYAMFRVTQEWFDRFRPQVGGYYVVYEGDCYSSFSPAKAFEEGYTRITE